MKKKFLWQTRKQILSLLLCAGSMISAGCDNHNSQNPKIYFCNQEEGRDIVSVRDNYCNNLSKKDLYYRLHEKGMESTVDNYIAVACESVSEWSEEEISWWKKCFDRVFKVADSCGYSLPLPGEIKVVNSAMEEEGGAAGYTRGTTIFLNSKVMMGREEKGVELVAHELFHVLTRNCPDFRKAMYKQVGFHVLDREIVLPDTLRKIQLSNPDVNLHDNYIKLHKGLEGDKPHALFLYFGKPYAGGAFFNYFAIGLLPLDENMNPVMQEDGTPIIRSLYDYADFFEQVGRNTDYLLDVEEILAENFVLALFGEEEKMVSPEVIAKVRGVMKNGHWK